MINIVFPGIVQKIYRKNKIKTIDRWIGFATSMDFSGKW